MEVPSQYTFTHARTLLPTGIEMHFVTAGTGTPVVLVHGWPDCWFGYRKQIAPLADAGFRVIVPDMRGFGQTSAPTAVEGYSFLSLTSDLVALLDFLQIQKAIFIGHDHGGSVVWRMCLHHPTRVIAVAALCTPYTPPNKSYVSIQQIAELVPSFQYQVYFNDGDKPVEEFEQNLEKMFRYFMRGSKDSRSKSFKLAVASGPLLPSEDIEPSQILTKEEFDYYIAQYKLSGFRGNINYYRTHQINFRDEQTVDPIIHHPALMVTAGRDFVLLPSLTRKMEQTVVDLQRGHVEEANHWLLQEFPEEVNSILIGWLQSLKAAKL